MAFDFGITDYFSDPRSQPHPVIEALAKAITMPARKGVVYQMMGPPPTPITNKEFEVYSRSKSTRNGVIGATAWTNSATSGLEIDVPYINGLTVGHQLKIDDEIVVVSAVDRSAGTISVFGRGMCETTAATHAAGAKFEVVGFASRDTDLKNTEGVMESTLRRKNYVQTIYELLDWEKGAELERKGLAKENVIAMLQEEAGIRVAETLSKMAIHGRRQLGTRNIPYATNGLLASLVDKGDNNECPIKVYDASGPITETKLHDALDMVFDYGNPDAIILSNKNARKFKSFPNMGDESIITNIQTTRGDTGVGRHVTHYDYNGTSLQLVIDIDMPDDKIVLATTADLKKGWLAGDALTTKVEPTLSSREYRESIQGTIGFLVENVGYSHLLIQGVTV